MTVILFGIIRGLMMHVTLVEINVHDDKVEQFIDVFRQNHLGSIKEPGNLRFDVLQIRRCLRDFIFMKPTLMNRPSLFTRQRHTTKLAWSSLNR